MKIAKRLLIWIAVALILQNSLFLFLDKYYLKTDTNFKAIKVEKENEQTQKNAAVKFPENVGDLSISFNGKYVAYIADENIYIVNIDKNETKKVPLNAGSTPIFYKWLPDINRIIIAEKYIKDKKIRFSYYDVKMEESVEVNDYLSNTEVYIPLKSTSDEIDDITISTKTQVMYIKVGQKGKRCSLYRIDRMSRLEPLSIYGHIVGNIASTNHDDKLLYEDSTYHRIGISDMPPIKIKDSEEEVLLGIDENDCVYIGEAHSDKIQKIYYGKLKEKFSEWKIYILQEPVYKDDVIIMNDGKMYINNSLKGNIMDINSNITKNYEGRLLKVCTDNVYSVQDNRLITTSLKQ
jgi:hypothetical protein